MSNFKIGDYVYCVRNEETDLTDELYEVTSAYRGGVMIAICDKNKLNRGLFCASRFELVNTTTATQVLTLPTDSKTRKDYPLLSGCVKYFPAALAGAANISKLGNDKHNPGEKLHHARGKSMDHGDCIIRHLIDTEDLLAALGRGSDIKKEQILLEANQLVWRALAYSQQLHENFGAPLAPGAKLPESAK